MNYLHKLKQRYAHVPQLRRIAKHRQLPRAILKQKAEAKIVKAAKDKKLENRKRHSKPGTVEREPERAKAIVREID